VGETVDVEEDHPEMKHEEREKIAQVHCQQCYVMSKPKSVGWLFVFKNTTI
jgi:hypothetical protein